MTFRTITTSLLAAGLIAASLPAQATTTVRLSLCTSAAYGNQSGLLLIEPGTRTFVPVGAAGLTETIARNENRARAWAASSEYAPADAVFINYDGYMCGLMIEQGTETARSTDFDGARLEELTVLEEVFQDGEGEGETGGEGEFDPREALEISVVQAN